MRTLGTETFLWHYNVCDSAATNVQCDPDGNIPIHLTWRKTGGNATPELYTTAEIFNQIQH